MARCSKVKSFPRDRPLLAKPIAKVDKEAASGTRTLMSIETQPSCLYSSLAYFIKLLDICLYLPNQTCTYTNGQRVHALLLILSLLNPKDILHFFLTKLQIKVNDCLGYAFIDRDNCVSLLNDNASWVYYTRGMFAMPAYRDLKRIMSTGICLLINGETRESFLVKFKFG